MILILGKGKSGQAAIDFFTKRECPFRVVERAEGIPDFEGVDLVVKSPGILMNNPWVLFARERGIKIVGEIDLAFPELKGKKLLAVTGSNGKTTTVLAIKHVLGDRALACGNIGLPLLSVIDHPAEIFVVELSSFQLETIDVSPIFHAAALLNISANHLDHHPSMEDYVAAKMRLEQCVMRGGYFFTQKDIERFSQTEYRVEAAAHDRENFAAACALCETVGVSRKEFEQKIKTFRKPPHRIEFIDTIYGVDYINDSKATSVDAVKKAVATMTKPVILIAGGVDKGGVYSEWIPTFEGKVKKLFAIGQAASRIEQELKCVIQVQREASLEEALKKASKEAEFGDCVLLSPGCSSFDQFKSFEERGEVFRKFVLRSKA